MDNIVNLIEAGRIEDARSAIEILERAAALQGVLTAKTVGRVAQTDDTEAFFRSLNSYFILHRDEPTLQRALESGDIAAIVPKPVYDRIMSLASQDGISSKAFHIQMNAPIFPIPVLNQASVTSGSPWAAGVSVNIVGEGNDIGQTEPAFTSADLVSYMVAAVTVIAKQVAQDAPVVAQLLPVLYGNGLRAWKDNIMLNGTGTNQPLGILNSQALMKVSHTGTDTVTKEDVFSMLSVFSGDRSKAVWLCANDVLPHLWKLKYEVLDDRTDPNTLLGIPLFPSQFLPSAGSDNSLLLIDPSVYVFGIHAEATMDANDGPGFVKAQVYYRYMARIAGRPWLNGKLKLANGLYVSPFVALDYA